MRLLVGTALVTLCSAISCGGADVAGLFGGSSKDASVPDASTNAGGQQGMDGDAFSAAGGNGGTMGTGGESTSVGGMTADGGAPNSSGGADGGGASSSGGDANGGVDGEGGTCQPKKWCRDRDKDGHGDPEETQTACVAPGSGWVAVCDDCADGNALVHPGAECTATGYTLPDGVTRSFDVDCDGVEKECGDFVKAAATCGTAGPLACAGSGYLPNPDRSVTDAQNAQNAHCGSTSYRNCVSVGLPCVAQAVEKPAVRCH